MIEYDNNGTAKFDPETGVVFEQTIKKLMGILKIWVLVENRRPDLVGYEAIYKTQVRVDLFGKRISSFIFRGNSIPFILLDGKNVKIAPHGALFCFVATIYHLRAYMASYGPVTPS